MVQVVPFHAARRTRPRVVPTRNVFASIARMAEAPSPGGSPSDTVVHGGSPVLVIHDAIAEADAPPVEAGGLSAPMPGRVVALPVVPGSRVTRGQPLVVLEAMKMEHSLNAPADGVLKGYRVTQGELVAEGVVLVEFEADQVRGPAPGG